MPAGATGRGGSEDPAALPGRLDGRTALVTGGGSGIGAGVVRRFVREGARVVAMGRDARRLAEVVGPFGDRALAVPGDVTSAADCRRSVGAAVERFGGLDTVVANAGVYDGKKRLSAMTAEELDREYERVLGVNLRGTLLTVHAALDELVRARGSLVITGSISSLAPGFGGALYVASKHALVGLAKQLAHELAGRVRVNVVAPGYVHTDMTAPRSPDGDGTPPDAGAMARRMPTGVVPRPDDVAGLYALLASECDGASITGSVFSVDSGQLLWGRTGS